METLIEQSLLQSFQNAFQLPFTGSVTDWANINIDLPTGFYAIPGKFDVSLSPYLIEPFKDLQNINIEQLNLVAATQTFKTGLTEIAIPYWIINAPQRILKLHDTDVQARRFTETRLTPLLRNCKPVKALLDEGDRFATTKKSITLPHITIDIDGVKDSSVQGTSCGYLLLDEVWQYKEGLVEQAIARTTAFKPKRKIVITSQPGTHGDQLSEQYNKGHIFTWGWQCPNKECGKHQTFEWYKKRADGTFAGFNWNPVLDDNGKKDLVATAETTWLECYHCRHKVVDTDSNRRELNANGKYIQTKDTGDARCRSYTWGQVVNIQFKFKDLALKYLIAQKKYEDTSINDDLKLFEQQILGKEWNVEKEIAPSKMLVESYDPLNTWPDEAFRFMAVDVQRKLSEKYYVIRSWSKTGESRLISYGKVNSWNEIASLAQKHKVATNNVLIDSGYDTTNVYGESIKRGNWFPLANGKRKWCGWICLKGDKAESYLHEDGVRRYYSKVGKGDPNFGQSDTYKGLYARNYLWSATNVKKILIYLRDGNGAKWATNITDETYQKQLYSIVLDTVNTKNGPVERVVDISECHLADCEAMIIVAALMAGIIGDASVIEPPKEETKELIAA